VAVHARPGRREDTPATATVRAALGAGVRRLGAGPLLPLRGVLVAGVPCPGLRPCPRGRRLTGVRSPRARPGQGRLNRTGRARGAG